MHMDKTKPALIAATPFTTSESAAVYRAIRERRDMRHFCGGLVDTDVLQRLLCAAHHAPSVGYMQPWRFVRIQNRDTRVRLHALVEAERIQTARALGQRESEFMQLKVQGILDAAEVLVVALADGREHHVFGRRTMPEMDLASAACAIQNLWLAARAEGLGMGWVSLFEPAELAALLDLPKGASPVAVLCLGPVEGYYAEPMLAQQHWAECEALSGLVFDDTWGKASALFAHQVNSPPTKGRA
ncbi:5,6-dimethylbenzimidazole synthase [Limnobacter sp.]|uniref:5,6-dimethylbenzimidazole synthase n=1 Tax=Limnobacter sp. TaxID=2003368 RepID=UPI002FE35BC8